VAHIRPAAEDPDPVASLEQSGLSPEAARAAIASMGNPNPLAVRSGAFGGLFPDGGAVATESPGLNARIARAGELPGSHMVADARSVARMYAATITDVDGVRLLRPDTVAQMSVPQTTNSTPFGGVRPGMEALQSRIALGFMLPSPLLPLLGPRSFGHPGGGGSFGFADPDAGIGFGYVMNSMTMLPSDPRRLRLLTALSAVA
jgi:CubicO group peptidase (beta-lactamase class C family)